MGYAVFDKTTKRLMRFSKWDEPTYDEQSEVLIQTSEVPSRSAHRWDDSNGMRQATAEEMETAKQQEMQSAAVEKSHTEDGDVTLLKAVVFVLLREINEVRAGLFPRRSPLGFGDVMDEVRQAINEGEIA